MLDVCGWLELLLLDQEPAKYRTGEKRVQVGIEFALRLSTLKPSEWRSNLPRRLSQRSGCRD